MELVIGQTVTVAQDALQTLGLRLLDIAVNRACMDQQRRRGKAGVFELVRFLRGVVAGQQIVEHLS